MLIKPTSNLNEEVDCTEASSPSVSLPRIHLPEVVGGIPGWPASPRSPPAMDPGGSPGIPARPGGRPPPGGGIPGGIPGMPPDAA